MTEEEHMLAAAELRGRIREWQEARDLRPSEVAQILREMIAYFGPAKNLSPHPDKHGKEDQSNG